MPWRLRTAELGDYLLALLPLLVTLLFLIFQLTPWSDECPVEEPCLGAADFGGSGDGMDWRVVQASADNQ